MGRFAIIAYRPKPGKRADLVVAIKKHIDVLREQDLVTDREPAVMSALDDTLIEVFEWKSAEAIDRAHKNEAVMALWDEFAQLSDYRPLASLREASEMFAEFDAVPL